MDEEPMGKCVVPPRASPTAPVTSPPPVAPSPLLPKSMEKKTNGNSNLQPMVTSTVPTNSLRGESLMSRDSSSSLQPPPNSADSVESPGEIERTMYAMPRTPMSMIDPVAEGSPSTQKKLHWKTREKLEKDRLKALDLKGEAATGSQEGSDDDASNPTDAAEKKTRKRKVYFSNHTPSGRKITPKDRWSPSPMHNIASLQGSSSVDNSSIVDTAISSDATMTIHRSCSLPTIAATDPPKKKYRYTGMRITDPGFCGNFAPPFGTQKRLPPRPPRLPPRVVDEPESESEDSDVSSDGEKQKKRKKNGSRKPWIRKKGASNSRRRTQLDMLLDDPMAINEEELGAQRTRNQSHHVGAITSPPIALQPSPAQQDFGDHLQGAVAGSSLFAKPVAPVLRATSSSSVGLRAQPLPMPQNNTPAQVQHTPKTTPAQQPASIKTESHNNSVILSPPAAPATSSVASTTAPLYIVPNRVNVDQAVEEWRALYTQVDPGVLFLFHSEVTKYFKSLLSGPPPSQ